MSTLRTNDDLVKEVLGKDYSTRSNPSLRRYIKPANMVTDAAAQLAIDNKGITLASDELLEIETWLAAHFYTKMDPVYSSNSQNGASGSFVRGKEAEPYKDAAIQMDRSGCVNAVLNRLYAGTTWVGKTEAEALTWEDRN